MIVWSKVDLEKFFTTFNAYWPGRLKNATGSESELLKVWRDVVQLFSVPVAFQALRDLFETQEQSKPPTPAAFKSIALPMQRFVDEKARLEVKQRQTGEKLITAQEMAADEEFWESRFDAASSEKHLKFLKGLRKRLQGGATVLEAVRGYV